MLETKNHRVLLIEDDKIDQMAFARLVKKENLPYKCTMVDTIRDAKNILNNQSFDVIVADYSLKDGTAFDILGLVEDTPIIFATGAGNEKLAVEAMKAGAYDYLIKNPSRSYLSILPLIIENSIDHAKMARKVKAYHENLEDIVKERTEQLQQEKELLSVTLSSMTDGVIVVDEHKNVILLNNIAEMLTGKKLDDARGKNINEILHLVNEQTREPVENPIEKVLSTGHIQKMIEPGIQILTSDKDEYPVSIAAAPIRSGCVVLSSPKQSLRTESQYSELRTQNTEHRTSISGAVILLHDRSQEHEIDQMKKDFISSVSHELRTPLTSIKAYTETILRDPDMPEEQKREFLITIDKESNRLAELVNSLLEISKIESGNIGVVKQDIDIVDVVEQIILSLKCSAENKNIVLDKDIIGTIPRFRGHDSRIRSLISNLIINAIKFTPSGGRISVCLEHNNNELKICVSDTGIGISQKDIPHIFDRFYRVPQQSRQIPGTGLGLAIVKETAAIHGGKVEIESKLGKGTTFKVLLPVESLKVERPLSGNYEYQPDSIM